MMKRKSVAKPDSQKYMLIGFVVVALVCSGALFIYQINDNGKTVDQIAREQTAEKHAAVQLAVEQHTSVADVNLENSKSEFKNGVVDGFGTAGSYIVQWLDLIVVLIIIGFIFSIFVKMSDMFSDMFK